MKRIPALLLSIFLFISITILYHYPLSPSTVYAETIDISPYDPVFGDRIQIEVEAKKEKGGIKVDQDLKIGPEANQLPFPKLEEESKVFSNDDAIRNSLPEEVYRRDLRFNDPSSIRGKIPHPGCGADIRSSATDFTTNQDYNKMLLRSRYWQAVLVPEKGSDLNLSVSPPFIPDMPQSIANCHDADGIPLRETTLPGNTPPNPIGILGEFLKRLADFLAGLLPGETQKMNITLQQLKYLPGEEVLKKQTVAEDDGFLQFFKPEHLEFSTEGDQNENTPYRVGKETQTREINYSCIATFKKGSGNLLKSLYPEELAPALAGAKEKPDQFVPCSEPEPVMVFAPVPEGPKPARDVEDVLEEEPPSAVPGRNIFAMTNNPKSQKLREIIEAASRGFNVPPSVLSAIAWIEGGGMWNLSEEEAIRYSAPGAQSPLNPNPNGCGAVGPMQFLNDGVATGCGDYTGKPMPDVWASYANAVNEATGEGRSPSVRNIKDGLYAAAKKLEASARRVGDTSGTWSEGMVKAAAGGYYGSCRPDGATQRRFGQGVGYCDFVWSNVVASAQGE